MTLKKNDFIEVEFVGKIKDGGVFDSNISSELKKLNPGAEGKPFVYSLGQGMFLEGIDEYLIGKEIGKHKLELIPEKAFGKRESSLVKMIPMKVFKEHRLNPIQGAVLDFDGRMGKILSVSGGRVIVDFNNPLAGKDVIYEINVKRKVDDINEKINAFNEFLFRRKLDFEVKGKKLIISVEKEFAKFVEMFKDKFKEVFDLDLEIKEIEGKKD